MPFENRIVCGRDTLVIAVFLVFCLLLELPLVHPHDRPIPMQIVTLSASASDIDVLAVLTPLWLLSCSNTDEDAALTSEMHARGNGTSVVVKELLLDHEYIPDHKQLCPSSLLIGLCLLVPLGS